MTRADVLTDDPGGVTTNDGELSQRIYERNVIHVLKHDHAPDEVVCPIGRQLLRVRHLRVRFGAAEHFMRWVEGIDGKPGIRQPAGKPPGAAPKVQGAAGQWEPWLNLTPPCVGHPFVRRFRPRNVPRCSTT